MTDKFSIAVDYRAFDYEIAGNAKSYGGRGPLWGRSCRREDLSVRKMDGETNRLQYIEYRVYGYKKIDKMDVARRSARRQV